MRNRSRGRQISSSRLAMWMASTALLFAPMVSGSRLLAQADAGLTGTVTDKSGAVIAGATVIVTDRATNVAQRLVTSSAGTYTVRGLNPGSYNVEVEAPGFQKIVKTGIPVEVSTVGTIDFSVLAGSTSEAIQVSADQLTLNTTQPQIGTTIDPAIVDSLPVEVSGRGRQIDSLQFLSPGTTGSTFSHRISGGVDFEQEVLYNGIPVPQPETEGMTTNFNPPYDLVGEVRLERTTFAAQFGLGQGAITYQTKSGTNQYHGSLFEINRNSSFDSVGLANSTTLGQSGKVPTDHENNYGFTIGGPITIPKIYNGHNRTFGLYSQEWFKQNQQNVGTGTVPTLRERQGDFGDFVDTKGNLIPIYDPQTGKPFVNNVIPQARISANALALLQYLPDPNRTGNGAGNLSNNIINLPVTFPNIQHVWGFSIDHKITDRQSIHYSEWRNSFNSTTSAGFVAAPNPLSGQETQPFLGSVFLLNYSNAVTDKLVATVGFGWVGEINDQFNLSAGYNSPVAAQSNIAPIINFSGQPTYSDFGTSGNSINRKLGIAVVNNWLWTKGRHTFNIGGEFRRAYQDDHEQQSFGGVFYFSQHQTSIHDPASPLFSTDGNPFASFLLGLPDSANRTNTPELKLRNVDFSPYIQDDIKFTPRLTINLGLRWDIQVPFTENNNQVVYFNASLANPAAINLAGQPLLGGLSQLGNNGEPDRANIHFGHVGPRVGFAYKLNDKTVVQGGYSIAFLDGGAYEYGTNKVAVNYGNLLAGSFTRNSTGSYTSSYGQWDNNPLPNPQAVPYSIGLGNGNTVNAFNLSNDGFAPYSQQWSVNVQRQLPFQVLLTTAWVGNREIHLPSHLNPINQLNPQYLSLQGKLADTFAPGQTQVDGVNLPYANFVNDFGGSATVQQALSPYPQYANIQNNFEGSGTTYYQSLQVEADKRLSNGLSFLIGYTLSRSMDNTGSGFSIFANTVLNKYNQKPEYTISDLDEPNTLKVSGVYELPIGPGKHFLNNRGITGQLTGGWKVGFILDYEQGTPIDNNGNAVSNGSNPLNGFNRPNRVPGVKLATASYNDVKPYLLRGETGAQPQAFNPAAFAATANQYVLGDALRLYPQLRNPNSYNENASLEKSFFITERYKGTLKFDYFNLLNRTVFSGIDTGFSDANYSLFTPSVSGNRQGQIEANITF